MGERGGFGALVELGPAHFERLRSFFEERELDDGAALFLSEDESQELYWIAEGNVRIIRQGHEEGLLQAGALLAALSLTAFGSHACDARALGRARIFALGREAYLRMRCDDPELALLLQEAIVRSLAEDLREVFAAR